MDARQRRTPAETSAGRAEEILLYPAPNIRITKAKDAGGALGFDKYKALTGIDLRDGFGEYAPEVTQDIFYGPNGELGYLGGVVDGPNICGNFCGAENLRWKLGVGSPKPHFNGVRKYAGYGVQTPYGHIMAGHRIKKSLVGKTGKSMFRRGVGQDHLRAWAKDIWRDGTHVRQLDGSWRITGTIGRSAKSDYVGFNVKGVATNRIEMIVDRTGQVRTMCPY